MRWWLKAANTGLGSSETALTIADSGWPLSMGSYMLLRCLQPLIGFFLELRSVQPLATELAGTRQVNSTIDSATRPTIDRTIPRRDTGHN